MAFALLLISAAFHAFLALPAYAHEIRPVIATMSMARDGGIELTLSLNLEAAMAGIGSAHTDTSQSAAAPLYDRLRALSSDGLRAEFERFLPTLKERMEILIDGDPVVFVAGSAAVPDPGDLSLPRISTVILKGPAPNNGRNLSWRFDPALGDSVMRLRGAGSTKIVHAELVPAGTSAGPFALDAVVPQSFTEVFAAYLELGFVHIVPKGLDHILFVLGLFLLSARLKPLLSQVTAFTLAHTVTLALGALGIVSLPPSIVEPLIAASIVYVAVENILTSRLHLWRLPVVFGFGLLHGLGFAGVLGDIGLADAQFVTGLVAFNLGVELGQLSVIAAAFLAIGWAARRPWYHRLIVAPASLVIAVVAFGWFVQRIVS